MSHEVDWSPERRGFVVYQRMSPLCRQILGNAFETRAEAEAAMQRIIDATQTQP